MEPYTGPWDAAEESRLGAFCWGADGADDATGAVAAACKSRAGRRAATAAAGTPGRGEGCKSQRGGCGAQAREQGVQASPSPSRCCPYKDGMDWTPALGQPLEQGKGFWVQCAAGVRTVCSQKQRGRRQPAAGEDWASAPCFAASPGNHGFCSARLQRETVRACSMEVLGTTERPRPASLMPGGGSTRKRVHGVVQPLVSSCSPAGLSEVPRPHPRLPASHITSPAARGKSSAGQQPAQTEAALARSSRDGQSRTELLLEKVSEGSQLKGAAPG